MLEEGAVVSVKSPPSRQVRRWWLVALASPLLTEAFGWALDNVMYFFRAQKFGADFWLSPPPLPWTESFEPPFVYFLALFAALAIVFRFGDRRAHHDDGAPDLETGRVRA